MGSQGEIDYERIHLEIVRHLNEAAGRIATLAAHVDDDELSNFYADWANHIRDWCDQLFPPQEGSWGGENVIRFPHERVS